MLGQYRLEADGGRDPGRVVAGVGSEQLLVARVPRTENDELDVEPHQPPHDVGDQVEAFLVVEPRDQPDHRDGGVLRQPHFLLQGQLVLHLLLDAADVVASRDRAVGEGIERFVVDAVDDPVQLSAEQPQQRIHLLPVLRGEDLLRVAIADGIDHVGEVEAAAEQVDDVVQPGHAGLDQSPLLEVGEVQRAVAEHTLEGQVMDGQGGGDVGVQGIRGIETGQHVGNHRRMPVVDVDHIGLESDRAQHLERCPAEVDEARVVVPEPVHPLPTKELLVLDEIDRHIVPDAALEHVGVDRLMRQRHPEIGDDPPQAVFLHVDAAVAWHHHSDVVTHGAQRLGQRAGHVGQSADFGKGSHLGGDQQDLQRLVLPSGKDITRNPHRDRAGGRQLFDRLSILEGDRHHLQGLAGLVTERLERNRKDQRLAGSRATGPAGRVPLPQVAEFQLEVRTRPPGSEPGSRAATPRKAHLELDRALGFASAQQVES